ncbi:MAG: helix-turn-helix domain-containing protein [Atopobiaceae bacterium]|nr:helix-turn-helix domain-containing protein [Atopobiaceae bacterium]
MAEGRVVYITEVPQSNEVKLFENEPDILTKQQVADLLGVTLKTVHCEIQRGRLGCFHVGTRVRITKTALLKYVEEQG